MLNTTTSPAPADMPVVWYKQFWPWFLIILPGTVVIASLITVGIAFKKADTLVADNYYKEGLAINKTFADINAAKALDIRAVVTIDTINVNLDITSNAPINDDGLVLAFSHPLDNAQDFSIILKNAGNGIYRAAMPGAIHGKWYITLQSLTATTPWRVNHIAQLPSAQIILSAQ